MSEILKVLNRKSVELKSEVVEFNMLDDIKKEYSFIMGLSKDLESQLSKAKFSAVTGDSKVGDFNKEVAKAEKLAKELGISVNDMNLQKLFSDVKEAGKLFDSVISV